MHWKYTVTTQIHLTYWRKGIFALIRKCIRGRKLTLSHSESCFGTHMPIERLIGNDEYQSVEH